MLVVHEKVREMRAKYKEITFYLGANRALFGYKSNNRTKTANKRKGIQNEHYE